ncbi:hypothetical protein [Acidisphaera sp. L21]|uniref:hypothetical protein n=1 Tax=Acidisphaera sp. L21 TaxID=1641851 RepID=UPI00131CA7E6|nr:hypothetical protein [Acidisphaera sp. L21]
MTARRAGIVGSIGLVLCGLGWALDPATFALGWVAAVSCWLAWPIGSMALLMIHALTGGRWGDAIAPCLRAGVATLPLLLPALVPILLLTSFLYPWARPGPALYNAFYLNLPFAAGRLLVYLVSWFGLFWLVLRPRSLAAMAPAGLLLLAVTFTFATIDLTMSLDPKFNSSIYGLIALAGTGLTALSVGILGAAATAEEAVLPDLARLLLGTVVLWTYLDFMQLLIVWQSDLASDAPWYVVRSVGLWGGVALAVAIGHFLLPFGLLLSRQRSRRVSVGVSALLLAMEGLRAWWLVLPTAPRSPSWIDAAALLAIVGCSAYLALRRRDAVMVARHV